MMWGIAAAPVEAPDETPDWNPSFDRDYWLAHCEGYQVESRGGRLGLVEEVVPPHGDRPAVLVVRGGVLGGRLVLVPTSDVAFIVPRAERLFVNGAER